jgi:fructose-1,6-bisphosphatase II
VVFIRIDRFPCIVLKALLDFNVLPPYGGVMGDPLTTTLLDRPPGRREAEAPPGAPDHAEAGRARLLESIEPSALAATRAAALACRPWVGAGAGEEADGAATAAMRSVLTDAPGTGIVVIGEGEKDGAPMLFNGERVGRGGDPLHDIAVDPLECTELCAAGLPGALATIAVAWEDTLWSPGPAFYMDKLVVAAPAREAIDLRAEPEENLARVADAVGRPVAGLRAVVLDKPRHGELIARLRAAGASVSTPPAGDVGGALEVLLGRADVLMGVGGTPEGAMTACAVRALGGGMQARLAPQRDDEARGLRAAGIDTEHILGLDDLVVGEAFFAATGVSGGLLRAPWECDGALHTESLVVATGRVRWIVERSEQR